MTQHVGAVILLSVLLAACGTPQAREARTHYYCPTSDVLLSLTGDTLQAVGYSLRPFPRGQQDVFRGGEDIARYSGFELTDCATPEFLCVDLASSEVDHTQRLVVPRVIESVAEYRFADITMLTTPTASRNSERPLAQVVLWSSSAADEDPIKLTIQDGLGIVYLSGITLYTREGLRTEACMLESGKGLLSDVRVLPIPIEDTVE